MRIILTHHKHILSFGIFRGFVKVALLSLCVFQGEKKGHNMQNLTKHTKNPQTKPNRTTDRNLNAVSQIISSVSYPFPSRQGRSRGEKHAGIWPQMRFPTNTSRSGALRTNPQAVRAWCLPRQELLEPHTPRAGSLHPQHTSL